MLKTSKLLFLITLFSAALLPGIQWGAEMVGSRAWPHPVPCRIQDGPNPDLFVMTLGDTNPKIADGVFDPVKDEVRLKDGQVTSHYYRDVLGLKLNQPAAEIRSAVMVRRLPMSNSSRKELGLSAVFSHRWSANLIVARLSIWKSLWT